jgi:glutamate 5-kinase
MGDKSDDKALRQRLTAVRRVVVKLGTNAICDRGGRLDIKTIRGLARQISALIHGGRQVTLVASGAIGAGVGELDLAERPRTMPELQAVAAVGQGRLMDAFHDAFARHAVHVAQVLLTREDFEDRTRYLNIRNTLRALHEMGILAIINENDAVAIDEIRYGDNDTIAAHVTGMLAAEMLVFLSSVDGVMDGGRRVGVIAHDDDSAGGLVTAERSRLGSGGMASKIAAARLVTDSGEIAVIANSRSPNVVARILGGRDVGTLFVPSGRKLSSRMRWIGQASRPAGRLIVDDGAVAALVEGGKSLLPAGIAEVVGRFGKGDTVSIVDSAGREVARGMTNYDSDSLGRIKGLKTRQIAQVLGEKLYDEAVHRNNMTLR